MATLHLICGLPGSGKSTLARKLEAKHPALRLTPDEWMERIVGNGFDEEKRKVVEEIQWEISQQALRLGINVILESGFWTRKERQEYRKRANELGAQAKLYFLDASRDTLWQRIQKRNESLPPHTFPIQESDLDTWIGSFERPTPDELI